MHPEEKEAILQVQETRLKAFTDGNQAMIEFSKMALRGTMLLNGAAIIPIIYSKIEYLYPCAIIFAIGALLSACATSMTYLTQWLATSTWSMSLYLYPFRTSSLAQEEDREVRVARRCAKLLCWMRGVTMIAVAGSLFVFGYGLVEANFAIASIPKKEERQSLLPPPKSTQIPGNNNLCS